MVVFQNPNSYKQLSNYESDFIILLFFKFPPCIHFYIITKLVLKKEIMYYLDKK